MQDVVRATRKYTKLYRAELARRGDAAAEKKAAAYSKRLAEMYASELFQAHNVYPTTDATLIYAVIAMCLELRDEGFADERIVEFSDGMFRTRKKFFAALEKLVNLLPNAYAIAEKWNVDDHAKRVADGSITYDYFKVEDGHIEYSISKCAYVDMFDAFGIRPLCRIFCKTDEFAYASLTRHVEFIRHSELATGPCCHDEVIRTRTS